MSAKLDIGACVERRVADGTRHSDDDPGEAAWDLADAPPSPSAQSPKASPKDEVDREPSDASPRGESANAFGARHAGIQPAVEIEDDDDEAPAPAFAGFPGFGDDEDDGPKGPGLDIMRFVRGIWKRKWIVVAISIIVTLLFLLLALKIQHKWQGTTTMIMQTHPDAFRLSDMLAFQPQNYDIATLIGTIKLPSALDETMNRVGIDVKREALAGAIGVVIGKESKIFAITAIWDDPATAARIANTAADLFIENSAKIRRKDAQGSFDYYSDQLREARAELDRVNAERVKFEKANNIASLDDQVAVLVGQMTAMQSEYDTNVAELGAIRSAHKRVSSQLEDEPEMVVTSSTYRSPFKQRLSEYQWELKEARTRYTSENPKIVRLQKRIEVLEQLIAESNDESAPENIYKLNPVRQDLALREQELSDQILVMEAQTQAQRKTLEESRAQLDGLSAARTGYDEFVSRLNELERLESNLSARVAEVRVLMLRNESGFKVLESATPPELPMPSMRKLVAAAGVILGGGLGLFVALLLEFLDPFVRTARDAQGITGCDLALEFQLAPYEDDALIDHVVPTAPVSVLFRRIINDLNTALEPRQWRSLAITSAEAGSGRSLVAINLASALGLKDEVTLVVDADVRADAGTRPSSILGIEALHPAQTITEVLSGAARPEDAFEPTVNPFVRLLTAGDYHNDNGLLLLGSRGFKDLAQHFDRERMHVLYDLPPLQAMESVGEAAAAVGNVMLVARSGHTRRSDLKQVTATLKAREIEIRAVVVTAIPQDLLSNKPAFASAPQPNPLFFRKHRAKDTEIKDTGPLIGDDVMIN